WGTFAPFFRASDSAIAMACLRLFTRPPLPPLPDFNVPLFLRRIALATRLPAALPYLLRLLRWGIVLSRNSDANPVGRVVFWDLDVGATFPARALEYRKPSNPCRSKRPLLWGGISQLVS